VALFGRPWLPGALSTWLVPLGLLGAGVAVTFAARARTAALGAAREAAAPAAPPNVTPGQEVLS
jgi:hypothetical protein